METCKRHEAVMAVLSPKTQVTRDLEPFLEEIRDSCQSHAGRKGYQDGGEDRLGPLIMGMGVAEEHAIGEIITKLVEFRKTRRRVLAVKIAGWAWRLWLAAPDPEPPPS